MKLKDIIPLHESLNYLVEKESVTPFKLKAKTRLALLKNFNTVKTNMEYFNQLKESALKEFNPDTKQNEDGSVIVSLENEKGKGFLNKLNEIMELDVTEDCELIKISYDDILSDDNDIPIKILDNLGPIFEENTA